MLVPLLVFKGIEFTTGHIFLYLMKGMSFPGWFSILDSPGRLLSPVGFKGNRFHYWTYFFVFAERTVFCVCSPVGFKGNRFHYWTWFFVFDERNEFPRLVFNIGLFRSVIFPCWF